MRLSFCLLLLCPAALPAQTSLPVVAPGLSIPSGSGAIPLALDQYDGKPELVPVHHSTVELNNHAGANFAAGMVFAKAKATTELTGSHARVTLHDPKPAFYVHVDVDPDSAGDSAKSDTAVWGLVQATVAKDRRIFARIQFTQITGHAKRADGQIDTDTETLSGGWLKIVPKAPLTPGEYAITPIPKTPNSFSTVVFDFTLDPTAPNATEAIFPNQ
jgi:hypothetical protein